jgi:hypothetical protein
MNPIHIAALNGDIETIKLLLDSGVNVDSINYSDNYYGFTPLMIAAETSNTTSSLETVKLLLDSGADVNAYERYGYTPLMLTVKESNGSSSLETVKLLLDSGADVNIASRRRMTALMIAVEYSNGSSSIETVKLLLDYGADINAVDNIGWNALNYAARYANQSTVKLLLDSGSNPYIDINKLLIPDETRKLIERYQWKAMYNNIILQSKQYSKPENLLSNNSITLPSDVWELILLRKKQQWLCKNLKSDHNKYILLAFAEMLEIPIPQTYTKSKLCTLISEQLAYGSKYSPDSVIYSNKRYNDAKENIIKLAYRLGIDIHQPINKILDEIGAILQ